MSKSVPRRIVGRMSSNRWAGLWAVRSGLRSVLTGRPLPTRESWRAGAAAGRLPRPQPAPPVESWPDPPGQTSNARRVTRRDHSSAPTRFDADLLQALNEEYRKERVQPRPRSYDRGSLVTQARSRVSWVHNTVDLRGARVLEIGCGSGFETWYAGHVLASSAHGVDITAWTSWEELRDNRCDFTEGDLAQQSLFPENSFGRIMSFTVWEHVASPFHLLKAAYDVLEPGGLFFLRANLYASRKASHRYRHIWFPWPHLLFDDATIAEWDARHGRTTSGSAWVNRLSWAHYQDHFERIGFDLIKASFTQTPIDEEFYSRFENVLGRFPRWDLSTDFFVAILHKPNAPRRRGRVLGATSTTTEG